MSYSLIPTADYKAACDAIREKMGITDLIKSGDMASLIATIGGISYLTFSSANAFTIATYNAAKSWDGTLYYSTDTETWSEWDGTAAVASAEHEGEQRIYMRGRGNSKITGIGTSAFDNTVKWVLTGSNIRCDGNIENLLDYVIVAKGEHPSMDYYCYAFMFYQCDSLVSAPELPANNLAPACYLSMFYNCDSLVSAPELPANNLADSCYNGMFMYCDSLANAPKLPATTLAVACYSDMFHGCTSLITAPELPAATLTERCYFRMFMGCTNLTTVPKLLATTLATNCYYNMFRACTSIKISEAQSDEYPNEYRIPTSGTGTTATDALTDMFYGTGGTFTGTPEINTTYYTSNTAV